ncbi:MAG TPA: FHA domain-containing protein [Thermoleophilaceae bacterium]|nr:FHA domain-containing protein [Thermoleophilaceae bacterium]
MEDPVAVALKFGFLAVLYLFLLWVARSSLRDLSRHDDGSIVVDGDEPAALPRRERRRQDWRAGVDPRLEVVAAMGLEPGTSFELGDSATMGRADGSDIPVDDPFASSVHARIFPRGQFMYIEDMGSTNGTYLNGRRLRAAERLKVGDSVRIGETEYRYQE